MIRTIISLAPEDKQWLEQKAKATNRPITALVRQAIQRMRQEDELKSPSLDLLLERTKGIWQGEDGLAYQQARRAEW